MTDPTPHQRLRDNIAAGRTPLDDEMLDTIRANAAVDLDVPPPRVVQLVDEVARLRAALAARTPQPAEPCGCCLGDPNTVCAACGEHSCWAGKIMCEDAPFARTTTRAPQPAGPDGDEIERRAELTHQALIAAGIDCKGGACIDVAVALAARAPQAAVPDGDGPTRRLQGIADLLDRTLADDPLCMCGSAAIVHSGRCRCTEDEACWDHEALDSRAEHALSLAAVPDGDNAEDLLLVRMPGRKSGRVTIGHSRLPVETIWELIAAGDNDDRIINAFPLVDAAALRVLRRLRDDLTEPVPDGEDVPARLHAAADALASVRHEDEWAVFCGDPADAEDIVSVFDDQADAEELAQRVIDARIGYRCLTITEPGWTVLERCGACGSVLDGELCCEGRRAEIEAGETVLRERAAVAAALARPTGEQQ